MRDDDVLREGGTPGSANHLDPLTAAQTAERQCGDVRVAGPLGLELGSVGDDHQNWDIGDTRQQMIDEVAGRRVDPMRILEDQQNGVA
jgi:hypothetical protein